MSKKVMVCVLMVFVLTFSQRQDVGAEPKIKVPKIKSYQEVYKENWDKSNITIKWKKVKNADGYQVCKHWHGDFAGGWELEKVNTKKTYLVCEWHDLADKFKIRVRAYRIVNDKKVYGEWSKKVNIKLATDKKASFSKVTKVSSKKAR